MKIGPGTSDHLGRTMVNGTPDHMAAEPGEDAKITEEEGNRQKGNIFPSQIVPDAGACTIVKINI